jgi:sortase A
MRRGDRLSVLTVLKQVVSAIAFSHEPVGQFYRGAGGNLNEVQARVLGPNGNENMSNPHTNSDLRIHRFERILLGFGLTFLAFWAISQIHRTVASRAAIERFKARMPTSESSTLSVDPVAGSPVDFALWSPNRVTAYKDSLTEKKDLPLALLRIPSINLEVPIFDGTDDLTLNRGIGRIEGTARIGETGNIGLAGHRDGFFRGLKDIHLGDSVELVLPGRTENYLIEQTQIVTPEDTQVLAQTAAPTITLVTCFPFYFVGSAPKRFIVTASFKNSSRQTRDGQSRSDGQEH